VHARGSAAHGSSRPTKALAEVTLRAPFQEAGKETPVFVRFSTVAGERGSKDTARDVRGFAVKFYTEEGNWDLVGNNIPVFFIQDAMKFPDLVHAVKPEPHHGMPQAASAHDTFWDFVSLMPEIHPHADVGDVGSRHPAQLPHDAGLRRAHVPPGQRRGHLPLRQVPLASRSSARIRWCGTRRSRSPAPIRTSIAATCGRRSRPASFPNGSSACRSSPRRGRGFSFDVLDATKLIPEELVPVRPVGRMVLNRNPDNFFAETEQVAFCTAHVVPGIDFTNDPLLAGRIHSYVDTQISRLGGANFHEIPINAPIAPVHNNQRDGMHRQAIHRGRVAYEPNSLGGGCPFQAGAAGFVSFPQPREAQTAHCAASRKSSPTTTRRPRCSTTARPGRDRRTSRRRSASN
jgi:catalase